MSDGQLEQPADAPITGDVHDMVAGPSGGKLMRGGNPRPTNPTPAEVSALARKRVYQLIPKLARIGANMPKRSTKGKNKGKRTGKSAYAASDQIRAIAELRQIAFEDRISASALMDALTGMTDDIRGFLPPETAEALLALIAPRFLSLR
jgi:hypothetical protein